MKTLKITAENFGTIRETLKAGESVKVNEVVTLTSYKANTEKVNANGKKRGKVEEVIITNYENKRGFEEQTQI